MITYDELKQLAVPFEQARAEQRAQAERDARAKAEEFCSRVDTDLRSHASDFTGFVSLDRNLLVDYGLLKCEVRNQVSNVLAEHGWSIRRLRMMGRGEELVISKFVDQT